MIVTKSTQHSQNSGVGFTGEYRRSKNEFGGANTL